MALIDILTKQGSTYSYGDGITPSTNPGATPLSKLHANADEPGYSINGSNFSEVNSAYLSYNDGARNTLPQPSRLDLNGKSPKSYSSNGPSEGHY